MIPVQLDEAREISKGIQDGMDYQEAARIASRLESLHTGMEAGGIEIRFWLGVLVKSIGTERGKGTIARLSKEKRIPETTLRIARRFAEKFDGDPDRMRDWVKNHVKSGKKANWQAVIDLTRANKNPRVLGAKPLIRRLMASVERSAHDLQKANEVIAALPEEEREHWENQVQGVASLLVEDATEFSNNVPIIEGMGKVGPSDMFFQPARSDDYKEWIHKFPCVIKGTLPVDGHHAVGERGMGEKASDYGMVPLSHELHMELHDIGIVKFELKYNINFKELALNYLHRYITGQWITLLHLPEPI